MLIEPISFISEYMAIVHYMQVRNYQSSSSVKSNESKHGRPLKKFEADASGSQTNNNKSQCMSSGHLVTRNDDMQMEHHFDQLKRREASMPSIKSYLKVNHFASL